MSTPQFDPIQGKAAFDALLPRLRALPADSLITLNADAGLAAIVVLGIADKVNDPGLLARFKSLPAAEFDASLPEQLPTIAWACWHAASEYQKSRDLRSDAKLPFQLVQDAVAIEARMQACCEYYLNDHPEAGPQLALLRGGTGHRDLAADLLGYASLYREHYALLSADKKYFVATDADQAVQIAEKMLSLLGSNLTPEMHEAADDLARAWTLLLDVYDEVAAAGRWLLRNDPDVHKIFPSLYSTLRKKRSRSAKKPEGTPAAGGG